MLVTAQIDSTDSPFSLINLIEQGPPYLGDPSVTITILDFSDFQCHLCARYVKNTELLINETCIQTGKAALVFKHLPNRGFDSMGAHLAAQCQRIRESSGNFTRCQSCVSDSIETIPLVLAENAGMDPIDTQVQVMTKIANSDKAKYGIDVINKKIADMTARNVYEPLDVKENIVNSWYLCPFFSNIKTSSPSAYIEVLLLLSPPHSLLL